MVRGVAAPLLVLLLLLSTAAGAKKGRGGKQPLRMKPRDTPDERERQPKPGSLEAAMLAFNEKRNVKLGRLSEPELEAKLRKAHAPEDVLADCRKARYVSMGGTRLAPKAAMVDALMQIEDNIDAV